MWSMRILVYHDTLIFSYMYTFDPGASFSNTYQQNQPEVYAMNY